jgi:TonB family protein
MFFVASGRSQAFDMVRKNTISICFCVTIAVALPASGDVLPPLMQTPPTPVQLDPARPLKIGAEFYPAESLRLGEEGDCVVTVVVDKSGNVHDPEIFKSTGFERLDAACIAATRSAHLIPATENGIPIQQSADIPIHWKIDDLHLTRQRPMFAGYPVLDTIVVTASVAGDPPATDPAMSTMASTCYVLNWIRSTGKIQAAQIVKSSGHPHLDDACFMGVINQLTVPAKGGGVAIDSWAIIPIEWRLVGKAPLNPPTAVAPIAVLAPNQTLDVDRLPDNALPAKNAVCRVHISVSTAGTPEQIALTKSTESPVIDRVCQDAARSMKFIPARGEGLPVPGTADIAIGWSGAIADTPRAISGAPIGPAPIERIRLGPRLTQALRAMGLSLAAQNAAGSADRAGCLVSLWYTGEGTVQAAQLVRASGFPIVDRACLQAVIGQQVEPGPTGRQFGGWAQLPINWLFDEKLADASQPPIEPDPSIPALVSGGSRDLLPAYPAAALAHHAQGICRLQVSVTAAGTVSALEVTQSAGSAALDQACKDTIYESAFIPATVGGHTVSGTTDIVIDWRLPHSVAQ